MDVIYYLHSKFPVFFSAICKFANLQIFKIRDFILKLVEKTKFLIKKNIIKDVFNNKIVNKKYHYKQ